MQPKSAFTFVLSNQKPSELPKAAVQHFLHHCCLTPAPTHPLSRVSTRSIPGKQLPCPSSRSSCSMPVLVAPDFRVPHPSSASFEHSLHSFCLPHIYPAQSSPSNFVCLWLAPFCVPQHHIWLPKIILTFFFFSVGCTSLLEQASRALFFQGCLCSDRIFFTIFLNLSGFFFPWAEALLATWKPTDL